MIADLVIAICNFMMAICAGLLVYEISVTIIYIIKTIIIYFLGGRNK
jgi:hypothetical protein